MLGHGPGNTRPSPRLGLKGLSGRNSEMGSMWTALKVQNGLKSAWMGNSLAPALSPHPHPQPPQLARQNPDIDTLALSSAKNETFASGIIRLSATASDATRKRANLCTEITPRNTDFPPSQPGSVRTYPCPCHLQPSARLWPLWKLKICQIITHFYVNFSIYMPSNKRCVHITALTSGWVEYSHPPSAILSQPRNAPPNVSSWKFTFQK